MRISLDLSQEQITAVLFSLNTELASCYNAITEQENWAMREVLEEYRDTLISTRSAFLATQPKLD